jgi:hypothetical protein
MVASGSWESTRRRIFFLPGIHRKQGQEELSVEVAYEGCAGLDAHKKSITA